MNVYSYQRQHVQQEELQRPPEPHYNKLDIAQNSIKRWICHQNVCEMGSVNQPIRIIFERHQQPAATSQPDAATKQDPSLLPKYTLQIISCRSLHESRETNLWNHILDARLRHTLAGGTFDPNSLLHGRVQNCPSY